MKRTGPSMAWNKPDNANSTLQLNKNPDPEVYSTYSSSDNSSTASSSKSGVWNSTKEALKGRITSSVFKTSSLCTCFDFSEVWTTKQILPKNAEKEFVIRTTLRELLVYLAFLTIVSLSKSTIAIQF